MRILIIRPCCIGDVVMATAALAAIHDAYPDAHITVAVGGWSQQAINYHPAVNAILDTGSEAMPVKSFGGFWRFVRQVRSGKFDIAFSFVRSPLMSLAVRLSGIPVRAGIDSNRRGFGYTHRYPVGPQQPQHEAEIYLQVVAQLDIDVTGYRVNLPVREEARATFLAKLLAHQIHAPYIVVNPAGGSNPGMVLDSKRWPPEYFATVANTLAQEYQAQIVLVGGPGDQTILNAVQAQLDEPATIFAGNLSFPEIGVLAHDALLYIGNDTGMTHLAAASGAKVACVMGISDPRRYAPYSQQSIVLWKEIQTSASGVASAENSAWDWERDGISPQEALSKIRQFLASR